MSDRDIDTTTALALIAAERATHVGKGYTPETDRTKVKQLVAAAGAYRWADRNQWPWASEFWKPRTNVENLIRAGALYQAAIDVDVTPILVPDLEHVAWLLQRELNAVAKLVELAVVPDAVAAVLARHQMVPVTAGQRAGEHENVMVNGYQCRCGSAVFPQRDEGGKPIDGDWFAEHLQYTLETAIAVAARPLPPPRSSYNIGSRFD